MTRFEVGKAYSFDWCSYEGGSSSVTIVSRTEKTVLIDYQGEQMRKKIYTDNDEEYIMPTGTYSLAPVCCAKNVCETENEQEEIAQEETIQEVKTMSINRIEELYAELEGKTERTEIEAVLRVATVKILKLYLRYEGGYKAYEGTSRWTKSDYVVATTDLVLENIAVEEERTKILADMENEETTDQTAEWTEEDFRAYFPNGEIYESDLTEMSLEEIDALNNYLERKDAEMWTELNGIREAMKYPLVVVRPENKPSEDMRLYLIQIDDDYTKMWDKLDKNFEMVSRCEDIADIRYLLYTGDTHTVYLMLKARGHDSSFEEWQSTKHRVIADFVRRESFRLYLRLKKAKKFLKL